MIFYLTKTGGDARMLWYAETYDLRFKIYNVLQRQKKEEDNIKCVPEFA